MALNQHSPGAHAGPCAWSFFATLGLGSGHPLVGSVSLGFVIPRFPPLQGDCEYIMGSSTRAV